MKTRRPLLTLALCLALVELVTVTALPVARAQDAFSCIEELRDDEVSHRLAYLIRHFEAGEQKARMWWYGSLAVGVAAMAFSWTLFALKEGQGRDIRDPAFINGVGGILLTAQTLALPFYAAIAPARLRRMPEGTPEQRRLKLRRATELMERSAQRAQGLSRWPSHVGSGLFALTSGTYLAARYDAPLATTQAFLAPIAIAELRVLTIPFDVVRAFESYRGFACAPRTPAPSGDLDGAEPRVPPAGALGQRRATVEPFGLGLRVTF